MGRLSDDELIYFEADILSPRMADTFRRQIRRPRRQFELARHIGRRRAGAKLPLTRRCILAIALMAKLPPCRLGPH